MTRSAPGSSFIFRTSATISFLTSFVLFQDAFSSVLENTTLGKAFIRSATTGAICSAAGVGQKLTIISYVYVAEPVDPANPDITFAEWQALTLTHVSGPGGCSSVSGLGWYALENVPGKIVAADAVMTFEICPEACKEIGNGEGWTMSYRIKPCA